MATIDAPIDPRDDKAKYVVAHWNRLNMLRYQWLQDVQEVQRYLRATSTADTEVGQLPWKNKTTIPKLTQLSDNLQAYYMAALMPNDEWFRWEGVDAESHQKAQLIERYMQTKTRLGSFRTELEKMIQDWIQYGVCFGGIEWCEEYVTSLRNEQPIAKFIGPKLMRISPLDCVIDPKARTFDESPLVWRQLMPLSKFVRQYKEEYPETVAKVANLRGPQRDMYIDWFRQELYQIDGFETYDTYLDSQYIEILHYFGDFFDPSTGEVADNRHVIVVDRAFELDDLTNPAWNGQKPFVFAGWRRRTDNLMAQGALSNLVGMQYRCDHLENLKADTFDQIVHPMVALRGDQIEEFEWGPGGRIHLGADGQVDVLRPDATVLNANNEIAFYHSLMEEIVGRPREAAGFRTPGEKTAFEVNVLQQGMDRGFMEKLLHFEEEVVQRALNLMFELAMRNFNLVDVARTFNDDTRMLELTKLTKENVVADGIFRPVGSKYFAARAKRVQELQQMNALLNHPALAPHVSGLQYARALEEELGFERYALVGPNIGIEEAGQTELAKAQIQQQLQQVMGGQPGEMDQQPVDQGV